MSSGDSTASWAPCADLSGMMAGDPWGGTGHREPSQALLSSCSLFKTPCAPTVRLSAKMGSWVLQTRCLMTAKLSPQSSAETLPSRIISS